MPIACLNRFFHTALVIVCVLTIAACGGEDGGGDDDGLSGNIPSPTPTVIPTRGPLPTPYPVPVPIATPSPTPLPSPVPTPTVTPTPTPTVTPTPTASPVPTVTPTPQAVTLAEIQAEVFDSCGAACHTGADPDGGLLLDSEVNSFNNLVDVASLQNPMLARVEPGNPNQSYLVMKIEGTPGITGFRMPPGGMLTDMQIAMIRDWITNGAPQTGTGTAPTSISKVSVLNTNGVEFTLRFSREIQQETVGQDTVQIYFQMPEGDRQATPGEYLLVVSSRELVVDISQPPEDAIAIQLIVNDPNLSFVIDTEGRVLDGDRDQLDGGIFRYVYPLLY